MYFYYLFGTLIQIKKEPSTGLDPVSRSQLWKLIESMKENRALLLTTHSMVIQFSIKKIEINYFIVKTGRG